MRVREGRKEVPVVGCLELEIPCVRRGGEGEIDLGALEGFQEHGYAGEGLRRREELGLEGGLY